MLKFLAYCQAGHKDESFQVLRNLTENAAKENRYHDASCYYRQMATQLLEQETNLKTDKNLENRWNNLLIQADIYYAYEYLFKYVVNRLLRKDYLNFRLNPLRINL